MMCNIQEWSTVKFIYLVTCMLLRQRSVKTKVVDAYVRPGNCDTNLIGWTFKKGWKKMGGWGVGCIGCEAKIQMG